MYKYHNYWSNFLLLIIIKIKKDNLEYNVLFILKMRRNKTLIYVSMFLHLIKISVQSNRFCVQTEYILNILISYTFNSVLKNSLNNFNPPQHILKFIYFLAGIVQSVQLTLDFRVFNFVVFHFVCFACSLLYKKLSICKNGI